MKKSVLNERVLNSLLYFNGALSVYVFSLLIEAVYVEIVVSLVLFIAAPLLVFAGARSRGDNLTAHALNALNLHISIALFVFLNAVFHTFLSFYYEYYSSYIITSTFAIVWSVGIVFVMSYLALFLLMVVGAYYAIRGKCFLYPEIMNRFEYFSDDIIKDKVNDDK